MRTLTMLRINPAVWIAPFLMLLAILATSATSIVPDISDPYPLALTSAGASSIFLVAPVCAACAAWEGGRLRRAGWLSMPHARSTITVAFMSIICILVVGLLSISASLVILLMREGEVVALDLRIITKTFFIIGAHTLLGFAIGTQLPSTVAVPSVLLIDYAWMVLPIAIEPLWLRHLNGAWISCCDLASDLAPSAFIGTAIITIGFTGTAILLLRPYLDTFRRVLAVIPTVIAFGVGALLVQGLGPDPIVARTSTLVCSSGEPRVCVWPEHRERLPEVVEIAGAAVKSWRAVGISVPGEFSEQRNPALLPPGASSFGFSSESQRSDILNSLVYSLLPPLPACAREGGSFLGGPAQSYVVAWLADTAGISRDELESRFGADIRQTIESVRALPIDQQQAWVARNIAALQKCDVAPQLEPHL